MSILWAVYEFYMYIYIYNTVIQNRDYDTIDTYYIKIKKLLFDNLCHSFVEFFDLTDDYLLIDLY